MNTLRRLVVVVALVAGWALLGADRSPMSLAIAQAHAASPSFLDSEDGRGGKPPHDLSALRIVTRVILFVKDNYVDPKRVKPKEMMVSGLDYVEKTLPDVMVDGTADSGKVRLSVNGKVKEFDISHVDSMWKMNVSLKEIFDFIARNMRAVEDTREIEYAAVNGMLQTLDPHSVLLRPEMYREMKLTTKGEFGGLGFVIQMKEGNLTVVKVLPKTPAFRAGIKKDDQIKKIGEESTVNMDLNEAVSKLRGAVDSKVTITIERKSWDKPQAMTLTRATISIESVQSKLLTQNVGYVRLKNFQGNTTRDLQAAIRDMDTLSREKGGPGMKGLVLDLRGNPGGLLDQATQVSDLFISEGTLVATVGLSDKLREEKKASNDELDNRYPVVVLVNAGSASASEIVAGALKNLDRAIIVGRQTFGKGSVQVLYDFPDDSALKLTVAKYLTPGDISIQEVGITPDIELVPTRVSKERVDVFATRRVMGEADLDKHFGNPSNASAVKKREDIVLRERPGDSLKYLKDEPKKDPAKVAEAPKKGGKNALTDSPDAEELDDQLDAESQDEVKEDFEVQFARELLQVAPFTRRQKMIDASKAFVADKRRTEEARIADSLTQLGMDWSPGETPKNIQLYASLKPGSDKKLVAGEPVQLELSIENKGTEPFKRLRAWTESDNGFLDRREYVFGTVKPGEKKTAVVTVKTPKDLLSRRDGVTVRFQDDKGTWPDTLVSELNFGELTRPSFAFNYAVVDDCAACNGDGIIQRGEDVTLLLDVTNIGTGKALDTFTSIKNASDQNVFIEKGRFKLGEIAPGETQTARFRLQVKKGYKGDSFAMRAYVIDEPLEEFTADKLMIPVAADGAPVATFDSRKGTVKLGEKTELYASAESGARVLARLPKGAVLAELGRNAQFARVELSPDRFAFVRAGEAKDGRGQKAQAPTLAWQYFREPPAIALSVDTAQGGLVTDGERYTLAGVVNDPNLIDMYVLVNDQKVFFKGASPADDGKLKFTTEFPLKEGNNLVTVVARESADFAGRKTIVVRRRPAAVAAKLPAEAPSQAKP